MSKWKIHKPSPFTVKKIWKSAELNFPLNFSCIYAIHANQTKSNILYIGTNKKKSLIRSTQQKVVAIRLGNFPYFMSVLVLYIEFSIYTWENVTIWIIMTIYTFFPLFYLVSVDKKQIYRNRKKLCGIS